MKKWLLSLLLAGACFGASLQAQEPDAKEPPKDAPRVLTNAEYDKLQGDLSTSLVKADSAWMMISTALVMLMVPGLALFYGGMVRRKNILATMMHSMVALAIVGVYWVGIGYSLAFGKPWLYSAPDSSFLGFSSELIFLHGITDPAQLLPGTNIPIYLHMLFQGMFAIITPALISGALAERIRFLPYALFIIVWVTFVYCPLAHAVWALDWWAPIDAAKGAGATAVGWLGHMEALDFAGGTVVHIAAGFSSLAAILVLRRRLGYPAQAFHPNSMVLTLTGAGILWFGWFGFNGGSAGGSGTLAVSAFSATQAAAAAAGLSWMLMEWIHRGKPTALGLASGIVAGLVAVTPASGYIFVTGGLIIGLIAGVVCYIAVVLKPVFKYDDSLDAFGVHGVGGFLGAVLTGVFCHQKVNSLGFDGLTAGRSSQVTTQLIAALASAAIAFVASLIIVKVIDVLFGFVTDEQSEVEGLDRTEHGETGFDLGLAMEAASISHHEPRAALIPPNGNKRFHVVVEGVSQPELMKTWSDLCQPDGKTPPEFKTVYPYITTVQGNRFLFRGGDQTQMRDNLQKLFQSRLSSQVRTKVEA